MSVQPLDHAAAIGDVLDSLAVPWVLGGSLAGSLHGEPRSTNDIDVALRLDPGGVPALIDAIGDRYYVPAHALTRAAGTYDSSNLLELSTGFKIDLFYCRVVAGIEGGPHPASDIVHPRNHSLARRSREHADWVTRETTAA